MSKWDSMTDEARTKTDISVSTASTMGKGVFGKVVRMKQGAYALGGKVFFDTLQCECLQHLGRSWH